MVKGAIAPGVEEVSLADFPSTSNCGDLTPAVVVDPGVLGGVVVRPTLVTDAVEVSTRSFSQIADLNWTVYDIAGKLVFTQDYAHFGFYSQIKLNMGSWAAGAYFLQVEANGKRVTERLMKVSAN